MLLVGGQDGSSVLWQLPPRPDLGTLTIERTPTGAGVNNETLLLDLAWRGGEGGAVLRIDSADTLFPQPAFDTHFALYQLVAELTDTVRGTWLTIKVAGATMTA